LERAKPPPPPPAPPPADREVADEEDARPATLGELRSVRRWLAVAGVWAVAASAIAIIALLNSNEEEQRDPGVARVGQLNRIREDLNERIDELETRVDELPSSEDVRKLERRVRQAETRASGARDDASGVREDVDDLQQRVEDLEQQQDSTPGTDQQQ
jgi:chromosome segregation ATPase